ncbi:RNA polymerase RpoN-/SigL-like sigma 54 subunit [Melghirimyces profundicolus]|uniref:RNA polymerase RpoN-/SigL-like sigma 54 subunit n=1 Tax=Melghirimyces profundicolus TaxID=1242148 RepID=A0A2T6BU73_9BACL|nr:RNA polymerase factor sigma-54 [Melghirimyces profundicolus]PTX59612.1 RNA polymerase RpoN-/SigL-like sigma 54 subunit [Melghirimyces profundicolus]
MALSMGYGLVQEQQMKLVMTPELRQAIQVLQLSASDLIQYIQEQAIENPVLEMDDTEREPVMEDPTSMSSEHLADWGSFMRGNAGSYPRSTFTWEEDGENPVERIADTDNSLAALLEEQIRYLTVDAHTRKICEYIIGNLDGDGYLRVDFKECCKRFNWTEEDFERALGVVQTLDPAGVGARSLAECLGLQLSRKGEKDPVIFRIVESHLRDLAEGKVKQVAERLGCSVREVQRAADQIRKLNPRPGLACHGSSPRYIFPDVTVREFDGEYEVSVNESYIPRLGISTHYERILRSDDEGSRQAVTYIKDRIQSAMWLLKSIEQRRNTLYRVTRAIVDFQKDFFRYGVSHLKPLTLREIAEAVELHESTVSRATRHKYMQTTRGLFPFRYFFPAGLSSRGGGITSSKSVKDKLERIIENEDKKKPLSDQKIADFLKDHGIRISRRTVAKYREEMGIASSQARRRF